MKLGAIISPSFHRGRLPVGMLAAMLATVLLLSGCQAELPSAEEQATVEQKQTREKVSLVATVTVRPEGPPVSASDQKSRDAELVAPFVPDWVADAIFYQIFPERFRNGDPTNDPTRASLETEDVPETWEISSWTADWYKKSAWEKQIKDDFYEGGVFIVAMAAICKACSTSSIILKSWALMRSISIRYFTGGRCTSTTARRCTTSIPISVPIHKATSS